MTEKEGGCEAASFHTHIYRYTIYIYTIYIYIYNTDGGKMREDGRQIGKWT